MLNDPRNICVPLRYVDRIHLITSRSPYKSFPSGRDPQTTFWLRKRLQLVGLWSAFVTTAPKHNEQLHQVQHVPIALRHPTDRLPGGPRPRRRRSRRLRPLDRRQSDQEGIGRRNAGTPEPQELSGDRAHASARGLRGALPGVHRSGEEVRERDQTEAGERQLRRRQRTGEHQRGALDEGESLRQQTELRTLPAVVLRKQGEL